MRSPDDGKSQHGDDGGKGVGSSGNDEETEDGSTVCTGDEVETRARKMAEGYKMLHARGYGRSNGVGIIVNEEISKEVVRVERWQGGIIAVWMMIRQQLVCVICVYGPQTGRTEAEKETFREEVERLAGLSGGQTMLCVAGDFNAHISVVEPGDEESIGQFRRGKGIGKDHNWWRC